MIIETILKNLQIPFEYEGIELKILCPFHNDRHPSLMINPKKLAFHCWSCKVGGGFEKLFNKLSRGEKKLSEFITEEQLIKSKLENLYDATLPSLEHYQINSDFYTCLNLIKSSFIDACEHQDSLDYLKRRGFEERTIKQFNLKYSKEGEYGRRIIMPLIKGNGNIGFHSRLIDDNEKAMRYRFFVNKEEIKNYIYNYQKNLKTVIIVEGIFDLMWLHQQGHQNVISFLSASASPRQLVELYNFKNIIFMFDNDLNKSGQKAVNKNAKFILKTLSEKNVFFATLPVGKDVNDSSPSEIKDAFKNLKRITLK
jgi:DNA primase